MTMTDLSGTGTSACTGMFQVIEEGHKVTLQAVRHVYADIGYRTEGRVWATVTARK